MKYIPKKTDSVDAMEWDYNSPKRVKEFMDFLAEHDLGASLCPGSSGGVAAEIYKDGEYHWDVEPYEYLIVEANGEIKRLSGPAFNAEYQVP